MSLDPKVKFKNKVWDSNYHKINPFFPFLVGIQISDPLLLEIHFSLQ
jgi:hypothetical protein